MERTEASASTGLGGMSAQPDRFGWTSPLRLRATSASARPEPYRTGTDFAAEDEPKNGKARLGLGGAVGGRRCCAGRSHLYVAAAGDGRGVRPPLAQDEDDDATDDRKQDDDDGGTAAEPARRKSVCVRACV
jgi:hypothetical protein